VGSDEALFRCESLFVGSHSFQKYIPALCPFFGIAIAAAWNQVAKLVSAAAQFRFLNKAN
jgi:hypothetical protein